MGLLEDLKLHLWITFLLGSAGQEMMMVVVVMMIMITAKAFLIYFSLYSTHIKLSHILKA